ncbi:hypothetical protein CFB50_08470 [Burkholderia sp. AU33423]|nr:hypothetical protein CFB50_08470 [Burkholderia sp. AU33423]
MENAEHVGTVGAAVVASEHSIVQQCSVEVPNLQAEDSVPIFPELDKTLHIESRIFMPCRSVLAEDLNQTVVAIDFI